MRRIDSRIDEVTVYAGAARVRRTARVQLGGDVEVVRLGGLPLALRDATVRLGAEGPVIAADARVVVEVPEADASLPPADPAALDDARREVAVREAEAARLRRALDALAALAPDPRPDRDDDVPPWAAAIEARLAVLALRADRERALRAALVDADRAADDARRRLARAEDEHRRATTARQAAPHQLRKAVVVTLRPESGGGDAVVTIEYVVGGARWAPTYVARLRDGEASLELRAVVLQATGEDWRGVRLALSTAAAQGWTELPELPSLRIGRRQPPPRRAGWKPPPAGAEQLYADRDRAFGPPREVAPPPPRRPAPAPVDTLAEHRATFAPVPQAAPPPEAMIMPMAAAKRSAPGGMMMKTLSAAVAAPAALVGAAVDAFGARGGGGAPPPDEPEPDLAVPDALLAYGDLRMAPGSSPRRGRLVPADRRDLYLQVLARQRVTVEVDVVVTIAEAERRAARAAELPPPPGTRASWPYAYDYAFRADGAIDVPSDGTWHGIALAARAAPVAVRHVVVPRESTDVFRLATLDNPHDAPLLPGPIDVYDGADFVLTSHVELTPPRGAVELGLGVDPRVKAARRTRFREEAAGMLRGSLRLEHEVDVDVENLGARPIELEVRERVPVRADAEDDDLDVTIDRVSPAWEAWTPEPARPGAARLRGGHRWRVSLGAGDKRTLELRYHVKIAGKHELVGGNRRES